MKTHLFAVLIGTCSAKLDPEAFKSASVSVTVHKSYINNLRKNVMIFAPMAAWSVSTDSQKTNNGRKPKKLK